MLSLWRNFQLFVNAGASGETLTSVVFEFKRTVGTTTEVYQTVTLTNAIVSSVREINGNGGGRCRNLVHVPEDRIPEQRWRGRRAGELALAAPTLAMASCRNAGLKREFK